MIKTNEVREGNLITRSTPAAATKILTVYNVEKASQRIGIIDLLGFDGFVFCENAEGITLTPEILEKTGFKKEQFYVERVGVGNLWKIGKIRLLFNDIKRVFYYSHTDTELHFLHQLQNLFFALSAEELDVKNLLK